MRISSVVGCKICPLHGIEIRSTSETSIDRSMSNLVRSFERANAFRDTKVPIRAVSFHAATIEALFSTKRGCVVAARCYHVVNFQRTTARLTLALLHDAISRGQRCLFSFSVAVRHFRRTLNGPSLHSSGTCRFTRIVFDVVPRGYRRLYIYCLLPRSRIEGMSS